MMQKILDFLSCELPTHKDRLIGATKQSLHDRNKNANERQQARIQEFTLVGTPWIGEGSGDHQGPQRVQGSA